MSNEMLEKLLQRWEKQPDVMLPCAGSRTCGEVAGWIRALRAAASAEPVAMPVPDGKAALYSLQAAIRAIYGELDVEDCAWVDREWMKLRNIPASAPDADIVAALEEYGEHKIGCVKDIWHGKGPVTCSCGFFAALAKAKGGSQPARHVPANDCKDPSSCDRHGECMYLGCSAFKGLSK